MSNPSNFARARSHIVFILGLLAATAAIWLIEGGLDALGKQGSTDAPCPPAARTERP